MKDYQIGCVYFFFNSEKELLYIGKTYNLKNRLRQHLSDADEWKKDIHLVEYMVIENEVDRDIIETYCINLYTPIYNKEKIFGIKPNIKLELPEIYKVTKDQFITDTKVNRRKGTGSFKDACIEYLNNPNSRNALDIEFPLIKECMDVLGSKRITSLSYCKSKLIHELNILKDNYQQTIKKELIKVFELNKIYTLKEAKTMLSKIYLDLQINKAAKCTTLKNYYLVETTNTVFNNKKVNIIKLLQYKVDN